MKILRCGVANTAVTKVVYPSRNLFLLLSILSILTSCRGQTSGKGHRFNIASRLFDPIRIAPYLRLKSEIIGDFRPKGAWYPECLLEFAQGWEFGRVRN
ncbi:MAG: hypothetical protein ACK5XV_07385 [Flavobacteriales bacterium]|jgi:hypothetical protein